MQVKRSYTVYQTLYWTRSYIALLAVWAGLVVALHQAVGMTWLSLPWLPMSLIGIAVAFTLGFKNNSSYARLWEARQIWGGIVNASRAWGIMVLDYVTDARVREPIDATELAAIRRELVLRHLAWITALRYQLRAPRSWEHTGGRDDEALRATMPERRTPLVEALAGLLPAAEQARVLALANPAAQIVAAQSHRLRELERRGLVDDFRHVEMMRILVELYEHEGKAERIKNFPFPRQYATLNLFALWMFVLLLPFGLISTFDGSGQSVWLVVPFTILVGWIFVTMELIGDYSENPFEGLWNDVPIATLARGIEIDLRQLIADPDVPAPLQPENDILS